MSSNPQTVVKILLLPQKCLLPFFFPSESGTKERQHVDLVDVFEVSLSINQFTFHLPFLDFLC